jgi:hypothetical protein
VAVSSVGMAAVLAETAVATGATASVAEEAEALAGAVEGSAADAAVAVGTGKLGSRAKELQGAIMNSQAALNLSVAACLLALAAGCAPTKVYTDNEFTGMLPKPDRILVYNFATSPEEVKLTRGIAAEIEQAASGKSRTEEEKAVGKKTADALAAHLVKELSQFGIPVDRASGPPQVTGNVLTIEGQFISIDQGNQTERVIIGLGMGRSDVKTVVQVYDARGGGRILCAQFETDAKSGFKPGAAETMGVGAAAGHLAVSAAATAGTTVISETFGTTVEADADRTAKNIVKKLKAYFVMQDWIPSPD